MFFFVALNISQEHLDFEMKKAWAEGQPLNTETLSKMLRYSLLLGGKNVQLRFFNTI